MRFHSIMVFGLLVLNPPAAMSTEQQDLGAIFSELENTFARGYQEKNKSALEKFLAPEYVLTISARPSAPVSRSQWLALLPNYNVRSFEIRDIQVRCLQISAPGKCKMAAVSSINKQEADVGGQDRSGEFFIVDIWAYRNDKWVVLSRYSGRTEAALPGLLDK